MNEYTKEKLIIEAQIASTWIFTKPRFKYQIGNRV